MPSPRLLALALFTTLACACDGALPIADGGTDANVGPLACADPSVRFVFPSPHFESEDGLVVPEGDAAADAVRVQGWAAELDAIAAWPRRPTLVLPLERAAASVDASRVHLAVREADAWRELEAPFDVEVIGGSYLRVQPRDPFPAGVREVLVALEPGVADARVLGACAGADLHPAYDAARASWPGGQEPELVLSLAIADSTAPLVQLRARLASAPALGVASSEAVELAALGEDAPSAAAAPHFSPRILRGQLSLPEYRAASGPMILGADGAPVVQGTTGPAVIVALPATGTAPYPVILYQHGGGQSPLDIFDFGAPFVEAGFAFVAIDLPEHGLRAPAAGGGDLAFLHFDSPEATRENFRQAVADHLAVLTGLGALNDAIERGLDIAVALDASRTFYMGMSLGGVSGSMTTALSRGLVASALFVGGAGYPELMRYGLFELAAGRVLRGGEPRPTLMLAVVEAVADAADPLSYAQVAEDRTSRPTPILFLQAIDDPIISAQASDQWARAFGASLARPLHHEAAGMPQVDLPASDTFLWMEGGERATRVLVHNPMTEIQPSQRHGALILTDYAPAMAARCFASARDTGSCEIIDTGFATR